MRSYWASQITTAIYSNEVVPLSFKHRWAQIAIPPISEANIFINGLAVPIPFKNGNGLVIEANFLAYPLIR